MKMTVKQALECIYLNKKMALKMINVSTTQNDAKGVIVGTSVLMVNIALKQKIDDHTKLSEKDKKALSATPRMLKDDNITPREFKEAMNHKYGGSNPFDMGSTENAWR